MKFFIPGQQAHSLWYFLKLAVKRGQRVWFGGDGCYAAGSCSEDPNMESPKSGPWANLSNRAVAKLIRWEADAPTGTRCSVEFNWGEGWASDPRPISDEDIRQSGPHYHVVGTTHNSEVLFESEEDAQKFITAFYRR